VGTGKLQKRILSFPIAVTLVVFPNFLDPFSYPKFVLLLIGTVFLVVTLFNRISFKSFYQESNNKITIFLAGFFVLFVFISLLSSPNKYTAIFGSAGRNSGLLTYLCYLAVFLLCISNKFDFSNHKLFMPLAYAGVFFGVYCLMQQFGLDFVNWQQLYDGSVGTLGNPNFAGAFMSLIGIFALVRFISSNQLSSKIPWLGLFILAAISIYTTKATQGYISLALGGLIYLNIFIFKEKRKYFLTLKVVSIGSITLMLIDAFGIGPLRNLLFKESMIYRYDFWRIAWKMFRDKPIHGVGFDHFGLYFRTYRDTNQMLRNGYENVSDSAHNSLLQLLSTGGIFLTVTYFAIVLFVLIRGLRAIIRNNFSEIYTTIFTLWLVIQVQSLISVDSIPMTLWSWVFGGMLVSGYNSMEHENEFGKSVAKVKFLNSGSGVSLSKSIVAGTLLVVVLIRPTISQYLMHEAFSMPINVNVSDERFSKNESLVAAESIDVHNPFLARQSAEYLYSLGMYQESIESAKRALSKFNDDYVASWYWAGSLEALGKYAEATMPRLATLKLDPLNPNNLLLLGMDYKRSNNFEGYSEMITRLTQFYPESQELKLLKEAK
jgi:O-antigen ligase